MNDCLYLVHGVLNAVTTENLAKIFRLEAKLFGSAVRQRVIVVRDLGFCRCKLVHIQLSLLKKKVIHVRYEDTLNFPTRVALTASALL